MCQGCSIEPYFQQVFSIFGGHFMSIVDLYIYAKNIYVQPTSDEQRTPQRNQMKSKEETMTRNPDKRDKNYYCIKWNLTDLKKKRTNYDANRM